MLSEVRARALRQTMTSTQAKAYDVIPMQEAWTFQQIFAELQRKGVQMRFDIFQGSVASLKDAGLIEEPARGSFIRAPIREKSAAPAVTYTEQVMPSPIEPIKTSQQPAPAGGTPLHKLEALATRVKKLADVANMLVMEAKEIAEAVEDVGLEIEERAGAESKELTKLRQLRELLRGD